MIRRKAIVVGGGFIGCGAAAEMARRGWSVTQVTRAPITVTPGVERATLDFRSPAIAAHLAGADAVVFATGEMLPAYVPDDFATAYVEQVAPVLWLAEQASREGVGRFVFVSSGGTVYGPGVPVPTTEDSETHPVNAYGFMKLQTEHALRFVATRTGLSFVALRVANPFGPGQRVDRPLGFITAVLDRALRGEEIAIWGDGEITRDFVHIADVSRAIADAAGASGTRDVLNIGSGVETSLNTVCEIVSAVTNRTVRRTYSAPRAVDVPRSVLCIEQAGRDLGWRPTIGLREGIEQMVAERQIRAA